MWLVNYIFVFSNNNYNTLLDESVLRDLTALLIEAKQRVPPFLASFDLLPDDGVPDDGGKLLVINNGYYV